MTTEKKIPVLLTVPHLTPTASPYREMMVIARLLSRDKFDLKICSLRPAGWNETAPVLEQMGIPCFVAPFRPTGKTLRHILISIRSYSDIERQGPFKIQHSLDFTSSPFETIMARVRARKYVYSQRNLNQDGHPFFLRWKIRLSDQVVAISKVVEDFVVSLGASPTQVRRIYNGLEWSSDASPAEPRHRDWILNVAHIQRWKRQHIAVEAFSRIADEFPDARLLLAGSVFEPAYEAEVKNLIAKLHLENRVLLLGSHPDIPGLIQQCGILLACSTSEGVSWSILEAMRGSLPVVASDIPPNAEIVEHGKTGLLAPVDQPDKFAEALRSVLRDPDAADLRARNAAEKVRREFTPEQMIERLEDLYRTLAAN
jgi:glycosyltransferase involved in cell wall biosynthesis